MLAISAGVACREAGSGAFQHLAHRVELAHGLLVQARHHQAAAGLVGEQAFVFQALQGFADGGAADAQEGGNLEFAEAVAAAEVACEDALFDLLVGGVGAGVFLGNRHGEEFSIFLYA